MAEVFRAAVKGPEGFRRELVVKRILPDLSARPRFTQMFVNEAKISALLAHPNIVQIFEFGEADGAYFIAMESIRGMTLREVLTRLREQERAMPVVAAAEITREVLIALDYAHNLRDGSGRPLDIVHRDVSPSNVMIADTGAVKVLDFGIARATDLLSDDEGKVVKGKIAYLAPEQITCGAIDARADVFAMGCVLHEILTGRVMFRAHNDLQTKIDLLAQTTPPPSAWNSNVPPALDLVVARATARDLGARYSSAGDMLADVENYLAAFRSSSRAVLRLMRSLSPDGAPDDEAGGPGSRAGGGQLGPTGAGGDTDATPRPASGPASALTPGPRSGPPPSAPAMAPHNDRASGTTRPLSGQRVGGPDAGLGAGQAGASGRAEFQTSTGSLGGAGSAEHARFTRGAWQRRLIGGAISVLALAVMGGTVVGGRSLWKKVSSADLRLPTSPRVNPDKFVLVTFVSVPPGARIVDGAGRNVGTTPATLPVNPSQIVVSFRLQLDGYAEATASTVPDGDKTISVALGALPSPESSIRTRKAHGVKRPSRDR
jgi:serine/threonine protein kinase